jgi:hypothetical protein
MKYIIMGSHIRAFRILKIKKSIKNFKLFISTVLIIWKTTFDLGWIIWLEHLTKMVPHKYYFKVVFFM